MKNGARWKDLTREEKAHLREWGVTTLKGAKYMFAKQREQRIKYGPPCIPCWECRAIAKKLGEEV